MKIYFHIGSPKTGSSTIQSFLFENRELLKDTFDLAYPVPTINKGRRYINGNFLVNQHPERELEFQLENTEAGRILFSEELLFLNGRIKRLSQLPLHDHEVKTIVYLRNPADYLSSLWGEFCKPENRSDPPSLQTYITSDTMMWDLRTLRRFIKQQKKIEFIIRPFDKSQFFENDLIDDFLHIFGIRRTPDMRTPKQQNISNKRKAFDVMQFLLSTTHSLDFTGNELDRLVSLVKGGDDRKVIETIDDDTIQRVCDSHADLIASIFKSTSNEDYLPVNKYPSCYKKERPKYEPLSSGDIDRITSVIILKAQAQLVRGNEAILDRLRKINDTT